MASMRDKIRAATVGKKPEFPTEKVDIGGGLEVEVRALTFEQAQDINDASQSLVYDESKYGSQKEAIQDDAFEIQINSKAQTVGLLLACCYDPDDGEPVFEEGDASDLLSQPANTDHWLGKLVAAVHRLNSAGNSKTTPND